MTDKATETDYEAITLNVDTLKRIADGEHLYGEGKDNALWVEYPEDSFQYITGYLKHFGEAKGGEISHLTFIAHRLLESQRKELEELRELCGELGYFVSHRPMCYAYAMLPSEDRKCTCGLEELLAKAKEDCDTIKHIAG